MIRIDASGWAKRNLWPLPSGELAVRPGLRTEFDGSTSLSGRTICAAFSVPDPVGGDPWFYIVHHADTASGAGSDVKINIYDADWNLFQEYSTGSDAIPEVVTHAEVLDFITISSPSFPTVFGLVGGGLIKAEKQDSVNSFLTALDVPAGICTAWASSRVVIARGSSLFISDPVTATGGDPRTFVAENQVYLEAPIYGLHTTAGGALVACTARGVYALSEQAAASGQVPVGDWQKLSDHETRRFQTTASVNGRLWGITRKGIQHIDTEGAAEVKLDDPLFDVSKWNAASDGYPCIRHDDMRHGCRLFAGPDGPIVSSPLGAICRLDDATGFRSWWTNDDDSPTITLTGVLQHEGGDLVLVGDEDAWRVVGNFDGADSATTGSDITGFLVGNIDSPVDGSPVIRAVTTATDGEEALVAIRNDGGEGSITHPFTIDGTAVWTLGTNEEPETRSHRELFSERTDDFRILVGARPQLSRISTEVAVKVAGPGRRGRP